MRSRPSVGLVTQVCLLLIATTNAQHPLPCVPCQNGAICNRTLLISAFDDTYGTCMCPPGFSGVSCEVNDALDCASPCLHNGTCVGGTCECDVGFTGPTCATALCLHQAVGGTGPLHSAPVAANGQCGACREGWTGPLCSQRTSCSDDDDDDDDDDGVDDDDGDTDFNYAAIVAGTDFSRMLQGAPDDVTWTSLIGGRTDAMLRCRKASGWLNGSADGTCFMEFYRTGVVSGRTEEVFSCELQQCKQVVHRIDRMANPHFDLSAASVTEHPVALTLRILIAVATGCLAVAVVLRSFIAHSDAVIGGCIVGAAVLCCLFWAAGVPLNAAENKATIQRTFTSGRPRPASTLDCATAVCFCNEFALDQPSCSTPTVGDVVRTMNGRSLLMCDNTSTTCSFRNDQLFNGAMTINFVSTSSQCLDGLPEVAVPRSPFDNIDDESDEAAIAAIVLVSLFVAALLATLGLASLWALRQRQAALRSYKKTPLVAAVKCNDLGHVVGRKVILHPFNADFPSGAMSAIIGPSGAGKTTLLDLLAGRRRQGTTSGTTTLSGVSDQNLVRRAATYVPDHSSLLPTQTVSEALLFAARMQLPATTPAEDIEAAIDALTRQFRIDSIRDTRVGKLSAGESKRLHIATAAIGEPAVMLLDEPTSGLDAYSARCVLTCLNEYVAASLGDNSRTIIMTIHQPSAEAFAMFQHVIALSDGQCVYQGPGHELRAAFEHLLPASTHLSTPDFALEIASRWHEFADASPVSSATSSMPGDGNLSEESQASVVEALRVRAVTGLIAIEATAMLTARSWSHLARKPGVIALQYVISTFVAFVLSGLFNDLAKDLPGVLSRAGLLSFNCLWVSLVNLSAIEVTMSERSTITMERHHRLYNIGSYLVSKFFADAVLLRVLPSLIACCIIYFTCGFRQDASGFFEFVGLQVVFTIITSLLATSLASLAPSFGVASLIYGFTVILYFGFGGFVINRAALAPAVSWLLYCSPFYLVLEPIMLNELHGQLCTFTPRDENGSPSSTTITLACDQYLFNMGLDPQNKGTDIVVLLAWLVFFTLLAVFSVRVGAPPQR